MLDFVLPIVFALFIWWASTGLILYLDGLPKHTFRWSMLGATVVLLGSLYGLVAVGGEVSVAAAYLGFTFGLLIWGWQEISFYMGYVTGPRTHACPAGCRGWKHFIHGVETVLYHELAIVVSFALVLYLTWEAPNQIGLWTFVVLWWMHESAKLNVFFGVQNLNEEFLPDHLEYLKGFLTKKPMNLLFPVSVTISTIIAFLLARAALAPGITAFEQTGYTFLATLMVLAILEHWFLVLPIPAAALWHWGLKSRGTIAPFHVEIAAGSLGAGKTSFLRRRLNQIDHHGRTVILVNELGEQSVDSSLMGNQGAAVVTLPKGRICLSLQGDLSVQLKEIVATFAPRNVVIEASCTADIAAFMEVLNESDLRSKIKDMTLFSIVDASTFLRDYALTPTSFEAHASLEPIFIVNKCDLVSQAEIQVVANTLRAMSPSSEITPASYGKPLENRELLDGIAKPTGATWADTQLSYPDQVYGAEHRHGLDVTSLRSWSIRLPYLCDQEGLSRILDSVIGGAFGEIERVKGIAQTGSGWIHFDVAGGRARIAAFSPGDEELPCAVAIGHGVDDDGLVAAFEGCVMPSTS